MTNYPRPDMRLIDEFKCEAHERELHRELTRLDQLFAAWRNGEIESGELSLRVHEFDTGPLRELFKKYNGPNQEMNVAYALVTGILSYEEVPEELVEALARQLAFYKDLKARNELRMPGE